MKTKLIFLLLFFNTNLMFGQQIRLSIVDELGNPVQDTEVQVIYDNPRQNGRYDIQVKNSDKLGSVTFDGKGPLGATVWVKKEGFYSVGHRPAQRYQILPSELENGTVRIISLRRITNPIPLFFNRYSSRIPAEKTWLGFDFKQGDWLAPHGEGKVADILFRYEREFVRFGPTNIGLDQLRIENRRKFERMGQHWDENVFREQVGIWDGTLEIAFPNEKEGLILVDEAFTPHSVLRMPHEAFAEGYQPTYKYVTEDGKRSVRREDIGFFLRTRVELDEDGEIISANYTKIYGDFSFRSVGYLSFTYYFNPEPNNRNLEFNGENRFPGGRTAMP